MTALAVLMVLLAGQVCLAESAATLPDAGRIMQTCVASLRESGAKVKRSVQLGDWYLHQAGFAFEVPEGMEVVGRYKGAALLLRETDAGDSPYRTTITVGIAGEDRSLQDLTAEKAENAYESMYTNMRMLDFEQTSLYGQEGVMLSYIFEDTQGEMLVKQWMFNRAGQCYVMMLTVKNSLASLLRGLEQFDTFTSTLLFVQGVEETEDTEILAAR